MEFELLNELGGGADLVELSEVQRRICGRKKVVYFALHWWRLKGLERLFSDGIGVRLSSWTVFKSVDSFLSLITCLLVSSFCVATYRFSDQRH